MIRRITILILLRDFIIMNSLKICSFDILNIFDHFHLAEFQFFLMNQMNKNDKKSNSFRRFVLDISNDVILIPYSFLISLQNEKLHFRPTHYWNHVQSTSFRNDDNINLHWFILQRKKFQINFIFKATKKISRSKSLFFRN